MGGFDDHVAIMGDWLAPSPSPRAFFASLICDDIVAKSNAESVNDDGTGPHFPAPDKQGAPGNAVEKDGTLTSVMADEESNSNALAEVKTSSCGGLMERMAARAGFNAPRLNTESIRHSDLPTDPEEPSPCLTIPPGLSPTTLLYSPVFLPNSLVLPSPTTGKFSFAPSGSCENSSLLTDDPDKVKGNTVEDVNASSFAFKPIAESGSFPQINAVNKVVSFSLSQQPFPSVGPSVLSENRILQHNIEPVKIHFNNDEYSPPLDDPHEDDGDPKGSDPMVGSGPSEDGYNWRKYGQKHVKGSEYPRSYYKCTHANCPVKKKVERSQEGHITEIIYTGAHNHPIPPPNRRSPLGTSNAHSDMQLNAEQSGTDANSDLIWSTMQNATTDWRQDNLEATPSAPLGQERRHETNALQDQSGTQFGSGDGVDASFTFSNDNDEDDHVTRGSALLGYDGEGDELESKRRRIETYTPEMSGSTRAIREPRVVVQTTSDVDILDDGYRWRKYGQKVVKGNPNPRSYYKCTSTGCNVRKHVERASHDLKSVITTYEGKHNHDVPAARNSSHVNSVGPNTVPTQQATAVASQINRPEPSQIQSSTTHLERPPLGSFNLAERPQLGLPPGFGFGTNQPGLATLGMAGLGSNQGKLPVFPVHSYLGNQPSPMNDMGFVLPKGEPKLEPVSDSGLNSSNGSSVYQQLVSRLPLGP